jgi:hypothetical protein
LNLLYIIHALVEVCERFLLLATKEEFAEHILTRFEDDPAGLLAFVDEIIEKEYGQGS